MLEENKLKFVVFNSDGEEIMECEPSEINVQTNYDKEESDAIKFDYSRSASISLNSLSLNYNDIFNDVNRLTNLAKYFKSVKYNNVTITFGRNR